jgi:transposase
MCLRQRQLYVVDAAGAVQWQGKCASTPEAISATLKQKAPQAVRIALETGPLVRLALAGSE